MIEIFKARLQQKYRTMKYPDGPAPELSSRYTGKPVIHKECADGCRICVDICPTKAIKQNSGALHLDMGSCLFCRKCELACSTDVIQFSADYRLAASQKDDLVLNLRRQKPANAPHAIARKFFSNSLKLRQVSAGGCNACEADSNVLTTPAWDLGRFGIQFVASPRHADGLLITGPVTENMKQALQDTYAAVPEPKIVIAVGACSISGGPYVGHEQVHNGAQSLVPVDLYIPGCPPHPLTILDGLLRFLGKID